ncbi:hypothetical protein [Saccharothrix longispora]|uniref:hypothetical protein n=1 Tax=Saccharothrix longispora TaxID=33920 RepID=UPI0028FD2B20|nr:hypothetical protein [Saccharothrix longispora]MDU0291159.1 hypothetical protein [Saccharothrix longispora]
MAVRDRSPTAPGAAGRHGGPRLPAGAGRRAAAAGGRAPGGGASTPDEPADLLAGAELLDEDDGRYVAGGGDWFRLHRVDADRALLVGCDLEDTETFFAAA